MCSCLAPNVPGVAWYISTILTVIEGLFKMRDELIEYFRFRFGPRAESSIKSDSLETIFIHISLHTFKHFGTDSISKN